MVVRDGAACRNVAFLDEEHIIGAGRHARADTLREATEVVGQDM